MKTVNIKGKEYVQVNERIKYFRESEKYKGWSLTTEMIELNEKRVVIKAFICNPTGSIIATGFAYEEKDSTFINKTSYIENCETSAWGRALGNLAIGIDGSIASADEVQTAVDNKDKQPKLTTIEEATADFIDAMTMEDVKAIWIEHKHLQKEAKFIQAKEETKKMVLEQH